MSKGEKSNIRIGVSAGDINGVGIETLIKALNDKRMLESKTIILYGHPEMLKYYIKNLNLDQFQFNTIQKVEEALPKKLNVLKLDIEMPEIQPGVVKAEMGKIALESLKAAVQDLASSKFDVLVTLPINKDTIQSDEFNFPGHTEYLAQMANVEDYLMLLVDNDLRVGVVTGHIPLKEVSAQLTTQAIVKKLEVMNSTLVKDFAISRPKIAVLGLNPHAGDNGLLGDEEKDVIHPAIKEANEKGILAFGSFGADGFFGTLNYKNYDGVLAMYHDQGLIPFKTLAFENGVNYTAGLPIIRTSPDHGTAYEIAGKNMANENSLRYAIHVGNDIYENRQIHKEISANPLPISNKTKKTINKSL